MNLTILIRIFCSVVFLGLCLSSANCLAQYTSESVHPLFSQHQWQQPNLFPDYPQYQWNQGGGMIMESGGYGTDGFMDKSWKRFTEVKNCVEEIFEAFSLRKKINLSWECCSVVSTVGPGCFAETIGSFDDDEFSDSINEHCANQVAPPPITTMI